MFHWIVFWALFSLLPIFNCNCFTIAKRAYIIRHKTVIVWFTEVWFLIFDGRSQFDSSLIYFCASDDNLLSVYLRPRPESAYGSRIGRVPDALPALAVVCWCSFIKVPNYTEIWNISWQSRRKMATVIHNPLKSWVFHSFTLSVFLHNETSPYTQCLRAWART